MSHPTDKGARRTLKAQKAKGMRADKAEETKPKKWHELYIRSNKVKRAQKLGFDYPRRSAEDVLGDEYGPETDPETDPETGPETGPGDGPEHSEET